MGAPILLGGATLSLKLAPGNTPDSAKASHDLVHAVLSEMRSTLASRGQTPGKLVRRRGGNLMLRWQPDSESYIEMILAVEPTSALYPNSAELSLDSWGYCKKAGAAGRDQLESSWKQLVVIMNEVIELKFAVVSVAWLTPREVDARYALKRFT